MKNFLTFWLFIFFAFAVDSLPQDDPCNWGIIFSVKKNFTLGKYEVSPLPQYSTLATTMPTMASGIAFEKTYDRHSFTLGVDLSLDDSKQDFTGGGSQEVTSSEYALRFAYNNYFRGIETSTKIAPFWAMWASFANYSNTVTDRTIPGSETKDEFSGSVIGFGLAFGFWWYIIESNKVSLGAQYNLGGMYYPQSTYTSTGPSGSTTTNGPSIFHFGDCGARLMFKASF